MRHVAPLLALGLAGCQPGPEGAAAGWPCGLTPDEGVVVRPVACDEDVPPQGEGQVGDTWLASPWLRAVARHPQGALSRAGVDGGTVVDVAPWGWRDRVHEVFALVDGGWLEVTDLEPLDDGVRVTGTVRSLPGLDPVAEGAAATLTWRLDPVRPALIAEGADGWLLHPRGEARLEAGRLVIDGLTLAAEGTWTDLGGAVRVDGTDTLLVAPAAEALGWQHPDAARIRVTAPDAEALELLAGAVLVARVPIDGTEPVEVALPPAVDTVRATATGRAASLPRPTTGAVRLEVGPAGSVTVGPTWLGRAHPIAVDWEGSAGVGRRVLPAEGGEVPTGPGEVRLRIDDVPLTVQVPEDDIALAEITLDGLASPRRQVAWAVPGDRAWTWRGTDARAVREAAATGAEHVVLIAEDDLTGGAGAEPLAASRVGVTTTVDGHRLVALPFVPRPRRAGHGAPDVADLDVLDAIAVLRGSGRAVFAPLDALDAAPPWALDPPPTHVVLSAPGPAGPAGGAWDPWFDALDAGVALWPAGPVLRVAVPGPGEAPRVDLEAGLFRGHVVASTGADLWLTVDGAQPGDLRDDRPASGLYAVRATARPEVVDAADLDRLGLVVDGQLIRTWAAGGAPETVLLPAGARWALLAGWSLDGEAWAATAPVWVRPAGP